MIYQSTHQSPTMSSTRKTSSRMQQRKLQSTASKSSTSRSKTKRDIESKPVERFRGRCRVQWSEKHVKEGLVLVQETQLARVVKTGPITEHYEIDSKPFASGQWAKVYRCRSRSSGILYAAKYSSRTRFNTDCSAELRHEIALLSLCSQSPRVVRLHDVYETPKEIILVMEYAPGGDLQTLIDGDLVPLEGDVVHFVKQLVEGLAYLHERNIAHLDIKPQNLVMMGNFPECDVKLCDFEISRVVLEGTEVREILGTPDYVAPEILHYEPITLAADMWSLGVTTYVLLTGFSPFGGETDQETFQNISLGEVDFPEELFEDVSTQAKDFVAKLLVLDPSARISATQCLRHDWLRDAPTQASPHLRRYLSKSREILLERVVSRENLRRAALMSQATSQANLSEAEAQICGLTGGLSQSEMCLSYALTGSRGSLINSDCYMSPANSQSSLNSSLTSIATSQTSLVTSQSYLLNKEQTQGLLNRAQSRSQAHLNHIARRGLLSRMRSLNQIQSQACLTSGKMTMPREQLNSMFGSKSQGKLYGLKCLSKSQGVLDVYRSLESIRNIKKNKRKERAITDDILPIFKQLGSEIILNSSGIERSESAGEVIDRTLVNELYPMNGNTREYYTDNIGDNDSDVKTSDNNGSSNDETINTSIVSGNAIEMVDKTIENKEKNECAESEENLDSLQSIDSDTLTEDSDETSLNQKEILKKPSQRQNSDISSHSNNSANSEDKDEHSETENDEPKYTVAQLVSAFNKHQEVASQTSLEAIMTEKRVNEVTFPTGPKALRLFIPDINITERGIVRRKTSYKPRKNWEELRKQNEKNEGVLKDFNNDSGNEDDEMTQEVEKLQIHLQNLVKNDGDDDDHDDDDDDDDEEEEEAEDKNEIFDDNWSCQSYSDGIEETFGHRDTTIDEKYKQCVDGAKSSKDIHNLNNENENNCDKLNDIATIASISIDNKVQVPLNKQKYCNSRTSYQRERLPNYIYPEVMNTSEEEINNHADTLKKKYSKLNRSQDKNCQQIKKQLDTRTDNSVNLKDILQKVDCNQIAQKKNMEKLRKRTSITKNILSDNLTIDDTNNNDKTDSAKSELPVDSSSGAGGIINHKESTIKLNLSMSLNRSSSLSSEGSCPTPSTVQVEVGVSTWEDIDNVSSGRSEREYKHQSQKRENTSKNFHIERHDEKKKTMTPEERRIWGKVCTGSYTRAMEKFNYKSVDGKKSLNPIISTVQSEKIRRKSSPAMPPTGAT